MIPAHQQYLYGPQLSEARLTQSGGMSRSFFRPGTIRYLPVVFDADVMVGVQTFTLLVYVVGVVNDWAETAVPPANTLVAMSLVCDWNFVGFPDQLDVDGGVDALTYLFHPPPFSDQDGSSLIRPSVGTEFAVGFAGYTSLVPQAAPANLEYLEYWVQMDGSEEQTGLLLGPLGSLTAIQDIPQSLSESDLDIYMDSIEVVANNNIVTQDGSPTQQVSVQIQILTETVEASDQSSERTEIPPASWNFRATLFLLAAVAVRRDTDGPAAC